MNIQPGFKPILSAINLIPVQDGFYVPIIPMYQQQPHVAIDENPEIKPKYKRTWNKDQVESLYNLTKSYCDQNNKSLEHLELADYTEIAKSTNKNPDQCMAKIYEIRISGTLRSGKWSEAEDELIRCLFMTQNLKWGSIANQINSKVHKNIKIRTGKQCKERWNNHLNPLVNRGEWTAVEDLKLLELHKQHENRWSLISKEMTSRTESAIKNRIKSLMNKELQDLKNLNNPEAAIERLILKKQLEISNLKGAQDNASPGSGTNYSRATMKKPTFTDLATETVLI